MITHIYSWDMMVLNEEIGWACDVSTKRATNEMSAWVYLEGQKPHGV